MTFLLSNIPQIKIHRYYHYSAHSVADCMEDVTLLEELTKGGEEEDIQEEEAEEEDSQEEEAEEEVVGEEVETTDKEEDDVGKDEL